MSKKTQELVRVENIDGFEVTIKNRITWGEMIAFNKENNIKPNSGIEENVAMLNKLLAILIESIKDKNGNPVPFSEEWLNDREFASATQLIKYATSFIKKVEELGN
jgi:hypothetical protein